MVYSDINGENKMRSEDYDKWVRYGFGTIGRVCDKYGYTRPDRESSEDIVHAAIAEAWLDVESDEALTTIENREFGYNVARCVKNAIKRGESASYDESGKMLKKGGYWQSRDSRVTATVRGFTEDEDFLDDEGSRQSRLNEIEGAEFAVSELPAHIAPIAEAVLNPENRGKRANDKIGTLSSVSIEREFGVGRKRASSMLAEMLACVARGFVGARKHADNGYFAYKSSTESTVADQTTYSTYASRLPVKPAVYRSSKSGINKAIKVSSKDKPNMWKARPRQNRVAWSMVPNRQLWPTRQRAKIAWNGVADLRHSGVKRAKRMLFT